ncbi:hypothetical protein Tco_0505930 [Tanacetum coccineum]
MDQNEECILGLSTVEVAKKIKELIKKDKLTIADLELDSKLNVMCPSLDPLIKKCRKVQNPTTASTTQISTTLSALAQKNSIPHHSLNILLQVNVKKKRGYSFLTSIIGKRSDDKEYEISYEDLPRLNLNDVEDIYLLKHNMKSLMKLDEVHKFCDGTLMKGLDKNDIKRSNEMLENIDKTLKRMEQLRRLEEYFGRRPWTFDPSTFVRP